MKNEIIVEELNTLLKGTYMGVRAFEHHIHKLDHAELRQYFQSMQQEAKQNASKIAERIQNLGGMPADDEGISGSVHNFIHKVMLPQFISTLSFPCINHGFSYIDSKDRA